MELKFVINKGRRCKLSCMACRKSKQKCDGSKPSCTTCIKKGIDCHYTENHKSVVFSKRTIDSKNTGKINKYCYDTINYNNSIYGDDDPNFLENIDGDMDYYLRNKSNSEEENQSKEIMYYNEKNYDLVGSSSLDLDLDFKATSLLLQTTDLDVYFNRYNKCALFLLPLALKNKMVMHSFAGWLLCMQKNPESDKFINESKRLGKIARSQVIASPKIDENVLNIMIAQTCQAIIGSLRGNYDFWRVSLQETTEMFNLIGVDNVLGLCKLCGAGYWVVGWFFLHNVFKLRKIADCEIYDSLIPKEIFLNIVDLTSQNLNENVAQCGPLTRSCVELFLLMSDAKSLYYLYKIKKQKINDHYRKLIKPALENNTIENSQKQDFLNSNIYQHYDYEYKNFLSFFKEKALGLEIKIESQEPRLDFFDLTEESKFHIYIYHNILKKTLLLFLKTNIMNYSLKNLEVKLLVKEMITEFEKIVQWEKNSYLLFSFFILSVSAYELEDRIAMEILYNKYKHYVGNESLTKIWKTVKNFWNSFTETGLAGEPMNILETDICIF